MTNFKKQFLALAYLSFLCNLIYSDPVDNNSNFDAPKQNYKKHSCDFKSCDNKRSKDCCKKHKKDVKSYEKKLGVIRGSIGFNGQLNATVTVASTPTSFAPNIYEATITPSNESLALVTKGKCFKADGYGFENFYIHKSPVTGGDILIYFTYINVKFNKKFKNPPTITVTEQLTELPSAAIASVAPNINHALVTPCLYFVADVTTTSCLLERQCIAYLPTFTGASNAIKLPLKAQEAISSDISLTNISFIASGEFCD